MRMSNLQDEFNYFNLGGKNMYLTLKWGKSWIKNNSAREFIGSTLTRSGILRIVANNTQKIIPTSDTSSNITYIYYL